MELLGVRALDALGDVGKSQDAEEVDVDRRPAGLVCVVHDTPQK